jgi:hypothetical protein
LQVLGAGERSNVSWFRADIVSDGSFEPWDTEVSAFAVDFLLDAADSGVLDCAVTTIDCDVVSYTLSGNTRKSFGALRRYVRTVEQRIVGGPDTSTDQDQSSESSEETFWRATSASTHSRGPSSEFVLNASPRFLGVWSSHYGGILWGVDAVFERRAGGDSRRWRITRVGDAMKLMSANHVDSGSASAKPLRAFPCCFLFGQTTVRNSIGSM